MPPKIVVLDCAGRIVMANLPCLGAALAVAATLDKVGQNGPYSAADLSQASRRAA